MSLIAHLHLPICGLSAFQHPPMKNLSNFFLLILVAGLAHLTSCTKNADPQPSLSNSCELKSITVYKQGVTDTLVHKTSYGIDAAGNIVERHRDYETNDSSYGTIKVQNGRFVSMSGLSYSRNEQTTMNTNFIYGADGKLVSITFSSRLASGTGAWRRINSFVALPGNKVLSIQDDSSSASPSVRDTTMLVLNGNGYVIATYRRRYASTGFSWWPIAWYTLDNEGRPIRTEFVRNNDDSTRVLDSEVTFQTAAIPEPLRGYLSPVAIPAFFYDHVRGFPKTNIWFSRSGVTASLNYVSRGLSVTLAQQPVYNSSGCLSELRSREVRSNGATTNHRIVFGY